MWWKEPKTSVGFSSFVFIIIPDVLVDELSNLFGAV